MKELKISQAQDPLKWEGCEIVEEDSLEELRKAYNEQQRYYLIDQRLAYRVIFGKNSKWSRRRSKNMKDVCAKLNNYAKRRKSWQENQKEQRR